MWLVCGQIWSEATTAKEKYIKQKSQKEEYKINRRQTEANQEWNDWKFQIHWNEIEWVNPMSRDERKINFVCLQKTVFLI